MFFFQPVPAHIPDVKNQPRKKWLCCLSHCLAVLVFPNRNPGGKRNCLAVSIIYQHGSVVVLIIKFQRSVLSPQLCSEEFLIGGDVFPKNKLVITESWWGEKGCRYRTFYEDKCIICRIGESDYRIWAEERVKREVAAPKCLCRGSKQIRRGKLEDRSWSFGCVTGSCLHLNEFNGG